MTVLLMILKIIGIILLALLGLTVLLILLLLFVPLRYRVKGEYHNGDDSWYVRARVSWLLHILVLAMELEPDAGARYLRIFGIKKNLAKTDNPMDYEENMEEDEPEKPEASGGKDEPEKPEASDGKDEPEKPEASGREDEPDVGKLSGGRRRERKSPFEKIRDRLCALWRKLRDTVLRIRAAFRKVSAAVAKGKELLADERSHAAVRFLGGRVFVLLRRVVPKKLRLKLRYSTGSPDTTGQLLGIAAMFPAAYQNRWEIVPDFAAEKAFAEAEFDVRGRIFAFHALTFVVSILSHKDCRYLIQKLKTLI